MIAISTPVVGLALDEKENVMVGKGSDAKESNEKQMPEGFAPSHFDVLVGWARQNFHHAGNCLFRDIISDHVPRYIKADSKTSRGAIISDIVQKIQSMSPSQTGFLKLDPQNARWVYIGSAKAKDKVGHALRKAVMSAQGGGDVRRNDGDESASSGGKKPAALEVSHAMPSSPVSNKRKASEPVSILKRGRHAKYDSAALTVETAVVAGPSSEEKSSLSRFFSSPVEGATMMRSPIVTGTPTYGLSPVARDIFDDKREPLSPLYGRRARRAKASTSSFFDSDDARAHRSPHRDPSSPKDHAEQHHNVNQAEQHHNVNQPQAPSYPDGVPIHGSLPPFFPPGPYYPPPGVPPSVHPPSHLSGAAAAVVGVPPLMLPPPSASSYYYPPGYYYYPGYGLPPPPTAVLTSPALPPVPFPFLPGMEHSAAYEPHYPTQQSQPHSSRGQSGSEGSSRGQEEL